ncbi:hypothetical protein BO83DRAFT_438869 [Aspergillus eucalypticola CBS 122712]|uniref:Uncharacterized protein n=1 Tax=Aspergillus eucalypticola (strain CBS 122712 / IBT 29274) TaxID=1448314 RepID=A0A317V8Z6_ASPEC|nr:uncharacterized protein BO83DRAFT_438869 [Aspergillus eucalypticola CBS 122712]PWY69467.1 hypothetical protein BO83DRAFT_438869 [Aspergillus eucalypticola CBS 122712]
MVSQPSKQLSASYPPAHGSGAAGSQKPAPPPSLQPSSATSDYSGSLQLGQNHHGREVSQPPGLTGEKHHHQLLTFDAPRPNRVKSKSRSKHKHKHSKSGDFRFPRRMNNLASSAGSRGLLPTWSGSKEKDNDTDDGLLRPITQETTWSRWSSDSTAALGSGSRKGSLLDVIDPSNKLGPIRRQEIRSMEDLEQVKSKRKQGEEYLRSALSMIGTLATDITRRLDYTYYNLLEKIAALNSTIASFQELSSSTSALFDDFQRETSGLDKEIRKQMGELKEFQPQLERIKTLEDRMKTGRQRAEGLNSRLEAMRHEIDRWDKKELEWQSRVNRRLRIFWTVVVAGVLAVLLAIAIQNWPTTTSADPSGLPSQALFLTNSSHALPPENGHEAVSDSPREAWPRSLRNLPSRHHNRPSGGSVPVVATATRDDTNVRTTHPDPLTIFDEL